MIQNLNLRLPAAFFADSKAWKMASASHLGVSESRIAHIKLLRRSIDARKKNILVNLTLEVYVDEPRQVELKKVTQYQPLIRGKSVIIIGAGPSGLFAALRLLESGIKPIILERGKNIRERRRDLAAINKEHIVNPNSNYCFGEGGAGTYSDGKLYTRSDKRGNIREALNTFVEFGADENILVDTHPHIGTNKLPHIIQAMRTKILELGGEIYFNTCVTDIICTHTHLTSVLARELNPSGMESTPSLEFKADAYIAATGHSARDIYRILHKHHLALEAKDFAVGVRVEHPQSLIDSIQYHCYNENEWERIREYLPPASYSLITQIQGRGVYSFCMCPGGIIAPCATLQNQVVTNGWSPSKRNNPFANSGIIVSIQQEELKQYSKHGVFAGVALQEDLEYIAWHGGGQRQSAPAQRLTDFVQGLYSQSLPKCSYQPGVTSNIISELLPKSIAKRLQQGFLEFGKKMRGYLTSEAIIVGFETRTSSPIRIPRNDNLQHTQIENLYPCAEGAGYAGGIISAAIDGRKVADAAVNKLI